MDHRNGIEYACHIEIGTVLGAHKRKSKRFSSCFEFKLNQIQHNLYYTSERRKIRRKALTQ